MNKLAVLALLLLGTLASASAQSGVTSKRLNFAYTHGNPDYVDLSSLGGNVFTAGIDNQMVKARNLKSFAVNFRGWRLMDEYIVDPEFFWELDPIALKGKIRTVNYEKISKYPSLEKRYKAIKPVGVNYIVCVDLNSTDQDGDAAASSFRPHQVCFRAQSYQMFWGPSRSGRAASYPGALLGWKEGVSTASLAGRFLASDNSDVNRLKNIVSKFRSVAKYSGSPTNTWLDIRWPDGAIDKIYEDFEEYEKEGKDLEKEYKEAKEEPKTAKRLQPLAADDEMAEPFEDVPKSAKVFTENRLAGLITSNGKKIFTKTVPYPLSDAGTFFIVGIENKGLDPDQMHNRIQVLNAAGKAVKIDGHAEMLSIRRNPDGTYTAYIYNGAQIAYRTIKCYDMYFSSLARYEADYLTREGLSAIQERDRQPSKPAPAPTSVPGRNVVEVSIAGDPVNFEFYPVLEYRLDAKLKVVTKGQAYNKRATPRCL